jgi:hypothetical protein
MKLNVASQTDHDKGRARSGAGAETQLHITASVGLYLNHRLRPQVTYDLDAVIVALKSWTTALLSWTRFALNFGSRNSYRQSAFPGVATVLADDRRRGRVDVR